MRILTVDDDGELIELLGFGLRRAGFTQLVAYDAPTALERFKEEGPGLIVLDLNLSGWEGLRVRRTAVDADRDGRRTHGTGEAAGGLAGTPFANRRRQ